MYLRWTWGLPIAGPPRPNEQLPLQVLFYGSDRGVARVAPERDRIVASDKRRRMPVPPGKKLIFRTWRRCEKTGQILHASAFGLRAWPILIDE